MKPLLSLARQQVSSLAITILSGFTSGILTVWQAWLLSRIISRVFLENATLQDVTSFLRLFLLAAALQGIFTWTSEISARSFAISIKNKLRQRLFHHILRLGPAFTHRERSAAITTAATEGIEALDAYFSQYLPQLALAALVPLGILFFVFPIDLLSALILAFTAPLIPLFMILIGKAAQNLTNRQYETLSRLSAHFLDSLQGLKTLKLFGRSKAHAATIDQAAVEFRDRTLAVLRVTFLSALVLELVSTLSTAIIAVEIGLRLLYFRLTFEQALFILVIAPAFYLPLRLLGTRFHAGMSGTSAARAIFELLNTQPQNRVQAGLPRPGSLQANGQPLVTLQNITYTYPGEAQPVLKNLSLDLYPGEFVAVVGPSGAGKSTLARLILGFLQPNEGVLLLNGRPFQEIDLKAWRESIAWVPQDPYLFHDTIAANLRLGAPGCSDQEMEAAARLASLDSFIAGLPERYNTVIMESGGRLSSGEAQRLALARAFLRQAPLILLDEPTSSVDPITESQLEAATRLLIPGPGHQAPGSKPVPATGDLDSRLGQKRTALVIAHRLNTIRRADRILVLVDGRLCESGSHHSLLQQQGGLYAEMVASHNFSAAGEQEARPACQQSLQAAKSPLAAAIQGEAAGFPERISNHSGERRDARPELFWTFTRLLGFLKGAGDQAALSALLGTATILSSIGLIGTSAWLISTAALHPSIAVLQVAVVGVRTFGIARGLFRYLERLTSHRVTFSLLARLRRGFYDALEPLTPARLMTFRSGDLLSRAVSDIETLENFYVRVVLPPLVALLVCGGTLFFTWQYSPALAGTLLLPLLALAALIPLWIFLLSRGIGTRLVQLGAALRRHILDGIQGLPDLLAFGREMDWSQEIAAQGKALGRVQMRFAAWRGFHNGMALFLSSLAAWLALVITIPLVTSGALEGVMLAVLVLVAQAVFEAVAPLPLAAEVLNSSLEAARRVFALVDAPAAVKDSANPLPPPRCESTLEVKDLTFRYSPGLPPALQNLSLQLERDKKIALVGPSGAGKSTLVNLLLRFWEDESGRIRLDGQELQHYSQEDVRRCFAVVPADPYFFNTTLRENLLLARPGASTAQVETAARSAQVHDFILTLPQGYETVIGERGLRLSGGQRQRLSIARALLKEAPILVTDEPTADLDPISEQGILETLLELTPGYFLLHITHRLVRMEAFDEIIVLDRGRTVQRGRHQDLLKRDGLYRHMWQIQQRRIDRVTE